MRAKGERVSKTVHHENKKAGTTYFLYNDNRLESEIDGNGAVTAHYLYLSQKPIAKLEYGTSGNSKASRLVAIHADHLGTPKNASDDDQKMVWESDSESFGKVAVSDRNIQLNLRFPGQYFDPEIGMHYNYYRNYDPQTGRYSQPDPIGLKGGINPYQYANSMPTKFVDPLGLLPPPICSGPDCVDPPFDPSSNGPKPSPGKLPKSSEGGPTLLDRLLGRDKKPEQYSCAKITTNLGTCLSCCASRSPGQYLQEQGTLCQQHCNEAAGISTNESALEICS